MGCLASEVTSPKFARVGRYPASPETDIKVPIDVGFYSDGALSGHIAELANDLAPVPTTSVVASDLPGLSAASVNSARTLR